MAIVPVQSVETKGEMLALELASMLASGMHREASERLSQYAEDHKLAYWESVAIADIAARMLHGQRWKK